MGDLIPWGPIYYWWLLHYGEYTEIRREIDKGPEKFRGKQATFIQGATSPYIPEIS